MKKKKPKSILKPMRSPKSALPKKVHFAHEIEKIEAMDVWYYSDSPKRKFPQRKAKLSNHTIKGSNFSTDLDNPNDFGPNPGYLSDYDVNIYFDDINEIENENENESIMDYMYFCECIIL